MEEYGDYECDICGIPLDEDDVYTVKNFFGQGEDGCFCYYHYSQMGFDNEVEPYTPLEKKPQCDD